MLFDVVCPFSSRAGYFAVVETSDVAAVVFPVVAVNASESALAEKQGLALSTLCMLILVMMQHLAEKQLGLVLVKEMVLASHLCSQEKKNLSNLLCQ